MKFEAISLDGLVVDFSKCQSFPHNPLPCSSCMSCIYSVTSCFSPNSELIRAILHGIWISGRVVSLSFIAIDEKENLLAIQY